MPKFAAIVLAAGQGKRMQSELPKVLHLLNGRPLLAWVLDSARAAGAERIVVVVGYGREQVEAAVSKEPLVEIVVQERQLGTGHAARCAECALSSYRGPLAVLSGDVPLLRAERIQELHEQREREHAAVAVLTADINGTHAYGRIVRNKRGEVIRIVEHKDATPEERALSEINTGTYAFGPGVLFPALAGLKTDNAQGEYYLTDTIGWFVKQGQKVVGLRAPSVHECLGINTPEELAHAEESVRAASCSEAKTGK